MYYLRGCLILLFIVASSSLSLAGNNEFNAVDKQTYDTVYRMCSQPDSIDFLRVYSDGALSLLDAKKLVQNRGLSDTLTGYFNSNGYYMALRDCFPNDENARNRFSQLLIAEDLTGKVGGAVLIYVGSKWLGGPLARSIQSFGVSLRAIKIATITTVVSTTALAITMDLIEKLHEQNKDNLAKELANATSSDLDTQVASGRQERDFLLTLLSKTDDPKVRELVQKNLDVISKSEATLLNSKERLNRILRPTESSQN